MKIVIYKCDECNKILSDDNNIKNIHLSINFAQHSGWVKPSLNYIPGCWHHETKLNGIKQFCDEKCLAKFFKKTKLKK